MKTRTGFVSNSSSSSFVIMVDKAAHEEVLKELHPYYQAWFDEKPDVENRLFMGKEITLVSMWISSEDDEPIAFGGEYPKEAYDYYGDGSKMIPSGEIIGDYISKLKAKTKDVIVNEENL